jgi:methyl-accepting chemotaxis protein
MLALQSIDEINRIQSDEIVPLISQTKRLPRKLKGLGYKVKQIFKPANELDKLFFKLYNGVVTGKHSIHLAHVENLLRKKNRNSHINVAREQGSLFRQNLEQIVKLTESDRQQITANAANVVESSQTGLMIIVILVPVIFGSLGLLIILNITRPLKEIVEAMEDIASGRVI